MSASAEKGSSLPAFRSGLLITGGALVAAGALIVLAGFAVGGWHVLSATRRWIREMEVPPGELAKIKWSQARSSAAAGANAGRTVPPLAIEPGRDWPAAYRIALASRSVSPPDQEV